MDVILENKLRVGNFTSSEIWKLMTTGKGKNGFGAPAVTYINEKNIERKMGVSLKQEIHTRPIAWGNLIEKYIYGEHLGFDYESVGTITLSHPDISFWKGTPDFKCIKKSIVAECKGYERKKFAEYAEAILFERTEFLKLEHPEEYWQLISNAIILGMDYIQPVLFMPYKSELEKIREFVDDYDAPDQWKYKFVYDSEDLQLPYLPDGGFYKNFNTCILQVPESDKKLLTEKIILAGTMLTNFHEIKS